MAQLTGLVPHTTLIEVLFRLFKADSRESATKASPRRTLPCPAVVAIGAFCAGINMESMALEPP